MLFRSRRPWTKNDSSRSRGGKRIGRPRLEGGGSRFDLTLLGTLRRRLWCRPATFKIVAPAAAADGPRLVAFLFTAAAGEAAGSASADEGHVVLMVESNARRPSFTRYAGPREHRGGECRSQSLRESKNEGSECVVDSHAREGGLLELDGVEFAGSRAWMAIASVRWSENLT